MATIWEFSVNKNFPQHFQSNTAAACSFVFSNWQDALLDWAQVITVLAPEEFPFFYKLLGCFCFDYRQSVMQNEIMFCGILLNLSRKCSPVHLRIHVATLISSHIHEHCYTCSCILFAFFDVFMQILIFFLFLSFTTGLHFVLNSLYLLPLRCLLIVDFNNKWPWSSSAFLTWLDIV